MTKELKVIDTQHGEKYHLIRKPNDGKIMAFCKHSFNREDIKFVKLPINEVSEKNCCRMCIYKAKKLSTYQGF